MIFSVGSSNNIFLQLESSDLASDFQCREWVCSSKQCSCAVHGREEGWYKGENASRLKPVERSWHMLRWTRTRHGQRLLCVVTYASAWLYFKATVLPWTTWFRIHVSWLAFTSRGWHSHMKALSRLSIKLLENQLLCSIALFALFDATHLLCMYHLMGYEIGTGMIILTWCHLCAACV